MQSVLFALKINFLILHQLLFEELPSFVSMYWMVTFRERKLASLNPPQLTWQCIIGAVSLLTFSNRLAAFSKALALYKCSQCHSLAFIKPGCQICPQHEFVSWGRTLVFIPLQVSSEKWKGQMMVILSPSNAYQKQANWGNRKGSKRHVRIKEKC